jgi:putative redox protein
MDKKRMKIECAWNEKLKFTGSAGGHDVLMDTKPPLGTDTALSPKQLVLAGMCGCTGMDVVSLLRKSKQPLEAFSIEAEAPLTEGSHPVVFDHVQLVFKAKGAVDGVKLMEAIRLSQSRYCGVSAMVSKAVPITYKVELNGESIGSGKADFT